MRQQLKRQSGAYKYKQVQTADAVKYKEIADAEAIPRSIELEGKAKADALKLQGMAEVDIIREKGKAEAIGYEQMKKAEAYKQYNDAAMIQMVIEKLPEIARAISEPLSKTEKIVIVDSGTGEGKGAAKITGYVNDIMAQLPETVEALTGIKMMDFFNKASVSEDFFFFF